MLHLVRIAMIVLLASVAGCASVNSRGEQTATPDNQPQHDRITTFLMFEGEAEEAMNFYTSLFEDSEIIDIERFGPDAPGGPEGTVYRATFTLAGRPFMAFDSPQPHNFTFTRAISLFVACESEEEQARLYQTLLEGGEAAMPLGDYGFSRRFGWIVDRFGVSWELDLPFEE